MKKNVRVILSILLFVVVAVGSILSEGNVIYAKTNKVKVNVSQEDAKTIKLNTTYVVSNFKKDKDCYVAFTLKEAAKIKVKISNVKEGTLHFNVEPEDSSLLLFGYSESVCHEFDETSATIDGSSETLPAGKYYIICTASIMSDNELIKSCNLKVSIID